MVIQKACGEDPSYPNLMSTLDERGNSLYCATNTPDFLGGGTSIKLQALFLGLAIALVLPAPIQSQNLTSAETAQQSDALAGIEASMERHKLTALSVAIFDDYGWIETQVFGAKTTSGEAISKNTAFSTASISKPVTALVAMSLAEEGIIDLDAPIAASLKRWTLPASDVPGAARVTWRQLLAHRGGTSQHGFADFYEGDTIPTLVDSVEGRLPRYDRPIEFLFSPGSDWKYSGGGYVIVQMALEDATGIPLATLAKTRVFDPLGMEQSTMLQPNEPGFPADTAMVHDEDGQLIRTGLPITPQVAASGMWSTPRDLALFAIAIQKGLRGETVGPITPAIAGTLTDIVSLDHVGGMATPFFRGFGLGNTDWFRHDGSNTGVNSDLFAAMEGGYGFVLMGNGDDANTGPVFAEVRRSIIASQGWAKRAPVASAPLDAKLRAAIVGDYKGLLYDLGLDYRVEARGERLFVVSPFFEQFLGQPDSEMVNLGDGVFRIVDYPNLLRFEFDEAGAMNAVVASRPGSGTEPVRREISDMR